MISLIETTVAPGTWKVPDAGGGMVPNQGQRSQSVKTDEMGSIIPFYLSVSLIIECTDDVHEDLAKFLPRTARVIEAAGRMHTEEVDSPKVTHKAGSDSGTQRSRRKQSLRRLRNRLTST